ncbi:hypothetical protein KFL_000110310 [Klebsormidium nitens]|uniref:MACPF-like domain-containing protein n=1 Tax=Klebsormidium nitens TaxID=105231 RepID=A0A1Y1HIL7_KLENI|nr:hypothetical protein KFL_000110310 [Klebsormidium nitens]|eukprot:GAQ78334.1 hypothetical protein KFL_000110310 [Klebsormidium nitens]
MEGQQTGEPGEPNKLVIEDADSDAPTVNKPEEKKSTVDGTNEGGGETAGDENKGEPEGKKATEKDSESKSEEAKDSGSKPEEPKSVLDQLSPLKSPDTTLFVGDPKNAELVKNLNQAVNSAVSTLIGGKGRGGSPNVNAADLAPQDWDKLFTMTGLYQGYDIDEKYPRRSMEPLFVLAKGLTKKGGPTGRGKEGAAIDAANKTVPPQTGAGTAGGGTEESKGVAKKEAQEMARKVKNIPTFLPHDKMSVSVETTQTERSRFFLENGFTSEDLKITVPYIAASVEAKQTETWAKKQATRTVYFTAKAEFPRCRIDIRSSVEKGYLEINPDFTERVAKIWGNLKARERDLCNMGSGICTLDGEADKTPDDLVKRRWNIVNAIEGNSAEAVGKALQMSKEMRNKQVENWEKAAVEIAKLKDILEDVKDLVQRFGAVWVEEITLGGQIYRTSKEDLTWEESTHEKSESIKSDVKAAAAGGGAGVGAMFGTTQKTGQSDTEAGNQVSHQAIGGDTLLYNANDPNEWLDSVKSPHHWRAIRYKGIKKLDELPGIQAIECKVPGAGGSSEKFSLHEMLSGLLKRAEGATEYAVKRARGPRRSLGEAWVNDLEGFWYGCYTWHKSLTQIPGAVVLTMEIHRPEVERFTAATSGVESAYLHQLKISGTGHDDKGKFMIEGDIVELENKIRRCKNTPYEILGVVEMRKHYLKSARGANWHGASTLKYAATRLDADDPPPIAGGCFTRFCKPSCRNDHTHALQMTDRSKAGPDDKGKKESQASTGNDEWLYRGHLDRLGMHGYWMYKGPTVAAALPNANQHELEFAQEGGTWTMAPVDELPRFDDLHVIPVDPPIPIAGDPKASEISKISVRLTDLGGEIKEMLKLDPSDGLFVMAQRGHGSKLPLPNNKMLKEVLHEEKLEYSCAHLTLTTKDPEDAPLALNGALDQPARIIKDGVTSQLVQPRSAKAALDALQKLSGFGKGVLKTKSGTVLNPKTFLERGENYVFVPEDAGGDRDFLRPPQDPWNFVEQEAAISEPRRRWILPPDAHVSSDGLPSDRPLSIDRFMGMWQGYVVEDFLPGNSPVAALESHTRASRQTKQEISHDFTKGGRKTGRSGQVLPPPVWSKVTACDLVGGSVGHAKYLVKGQTWKAIKRVPRWLVPSLRLEGTLTQVPVARPNEEDAKHSYPILAKVEAIGTPVLFSVRIPFVRKRFYKGHLDHLGMHGFTGRVGVAELRGTFGLMPVQADVDGRRKAEQAREEAHKELERRKKSAGRWRWRSRRHLEEDEVE